MPEPTVRERAIRAAFDADNHRQRKRTDAEYAGEVAAGRTAYLEVIVDAVTPIIAAEAWDDGFNAGEADVFQHDEKGWTGGHDDNCIPNPHRALVGHGTPEPTGENEHG